MSREPTVVVPRPPRAAGQELPDEVALPDPPPPADPSTAPVWVQSLMLAGGGLAGVLFVLVNPKPLYVFAGCVLLVATLGATTAFGLVQKRQFAVRTRRARAAHLRVLRRARRVTRLVAAAHARGLDRSHPPVDQLPALARGPRTWGRRPGDPDHLVVRLGTADRPARGRVTAAPRDSDEDDRYLRERRARLVEASAVARDAVVTLDLRRTRRLVVDDDDVARALLAHAVLHHAPGDLDVALVLPAPTRPAWAWTAWWPHLAEGDGRHRVVGPAEADALVSERLRTPGPGHLLVLAPGAVLTETGVLADLADPATADDPELTPVTVLEVRGPDGPPPLWADVVLTAGDLRGARAPVVRGPVRADRQGVAAAALLARRLAACRLPGDVRVGSGVAVAARAARDGGLLGLLGGESAVLDPARRWAPRPPRERLRVPVGIGADGLVVHLDLEESAAGGMGPHGLVVGATGSGKSELLRTLVAGLAVTHPPEELTVVLVDFKGGATFADLAGLPHLAGLITNLEDDPGMVDRAHDALSGELVRRQRVLKAAGVSSLAEHRSLVGVDPLPALLVVVDEFSELLVQRPDFADLFATIGRLGRSLGVHLLVASQRLEEGRLRGLESHLGYRVALRTLSAADSSAVLGVRDAFHLPHRPGTALLRVGSGDLVRFDAVQVGAARAPVDPLAVDAGVVRPFGLVPLDESPAPTGEDDDARPAATPSAAPSATRRVVEALADERRRVHQVWVEPLPTWLPVRDVFRRADVPPGPLQVPVGLLDLPLEQRAVPYVVDLEGAGGHLLVVGAPRSGRSTAVATLVMALAARTTPAEAQVYLLDLGGGGLGALAGLPHVGTVAPRTDLERVEATLRAVHRTISRREREFPAHGVVGADDLRARRGDGRLGGDAWADVVLVVDGLAEFRADLPDLERLLLDVAARGPGFGVHLVATAQRWGDVKPALRDLVAARLELRLADPVDSAVDRRLAEAVPRRPGRGLAGATARTPRGHVQVAAPTPTPAEPLAAAVERLAAAARSDLVAPPVLTLPPVLTPAALATAVAASEPVAGERGAGDGVLVGVSERDLAPVTVPLDVRDPHLLVFGDAGAGKTTLLRSLVHGVVARGEVAHAVYVVDFRRTLTDVVDDAGVAAYAPTPGAVDELVAALAEVLESRMPRGRLTREEVRERSWWSGPEEYLVVDDTDLVDGTGAFGESPLAPLLPYVPHAGDIGLHLVLARRVSTTGRASPLVGRLADFGAGGFVLSGDRSVGPVLGGVRAEERVPGRATWVRGGRPAGLVQLVLREGG